MSQGKSRQRRSAAEKLRIVVTGMQTRDIAELCRREGIAEAFRQAQPGDTVLLAGKGHEQSIVIGREKLPWDDRVVAREALAALGYTRDGDSAR